MRLVMRMDVQPARSRARRRSTARSTRVFACAIISCIRARGRIGACSRARGRIGVARTRGVESYLTRGTVARGIHAFARVIIQRWR